RLLPEAQLRWPSRPHRQRRLLRHRYTPGSRARSASGRALVRRGAAAGLRRASVQPGVRVEPRPPPLRGDGLRRHRSCAARPRGRGRPDLLASTVMTVRSVTNLAVKVQDIDEAVAWYRGIGATVRGPEEWAGA